MELFEDYTAKSRFYQL